MTQDFPTRKQSLKDPEGSWHGSWACKNELLTEPLTRCAMLGAYAPEGLCWRVSVSLVVRWPWSPSRSNLKAASPFSQKRSGEETLHKHLYYIINICIYILYHICTYCQKLENGHAPKILFFWHVMWKVYCAYSRQISINIYICISPW